MVSLTYTQTIWKTIHCGIITFFATENEKTPDFTEQEQMAKYILSSATVSFSQFQLLNSFKLTLTNWINFFKENNFWRQFNLPFHILNGRLHKLSYINQKSIQNNVSYISTHVKVMSHITVNTYLFTALKSIHKTLNADWYWTTV